MSSTWSVPMPEGRVLFTRDNDFALLHYGGRPHSGIVYLPQRRRVRIGEMVRDLLLIRDVLSAEEMVGVLERL